MKIVKPSRNDWFIAIGVSLFLIFVAVNINPPTEQKPKTPVTYSEISDKMANKTDAQWDSYRKELRGYNFTGQGYVSEVKVKQIRSQYQVEVTITPPLSFIPFVSGVVLHNVPKDIALKLNRGDKIEYSGKIRLVQKFLSFLIVHLNPDKIDYATNPITIQGSHTQAQVDAPVDAPIILTFTHIGCIDIKDAQDLLSISGDGGEDALVKALNIKITTGKCRLFNAGQEGMVNLRKQFRNISQIKFQDDPLSYWVIGDGSGQKFNWERIEGKVVDGGKKESGN